MPEAAAGHPPDYLVIGHVSRDLTPQGPTLGGTAAYSGLTAAALGRRVAVVTSCSHDLDLSPLAALEVVRYPSSSSTSFENRRWEKGRRQVLLGRAADIGPDDVPASWRSSEIVHLAPIAAEVDPGLVEGFSGSLLGVTGQGWLRTWDETGRVGPRSWQAVQGIWSRAGAVVVSLEDLGYDEGAATAMASQCRLLAITDGPDGVVIHWKGDVRRVPAPKVEEVDSTGSGDVFAAAFFIQLHRTGDPWEAARFANGLAAQSVTRRGLAGIPQRSEIEQAQMQVIP